MGRKLGAGVPIFGQSWVPIQHNVAGADAYLHAKFRLDPSNHLATIDQRHRQDRQTGQRFDSIGRTVPLKDSYFNAESPLKSFLLHTCKNGGISASGLKRDSTVIIGGVDFM